MSTPILMPREWKSALETFGRRKGRSRNWDAYSAVVEAVLVQLQPVATVDDLKKRYRRGNYWALQTARKLFPNDPAAWNLHLTADVAYGRRFLELTGHNEAEAKADREATAEELARQAAEEAAETGPGGGAAPEPGG